MAQLKIVQFLQTIPLCQGFTRPQLEMLANMLQLQLIPPKTVLFREGDPGESFFFIQEGEVGVYKRVPHVGLERIATLGPRDPVGHLCLIDGQRRSATCIAESRTVTLQGHKRLFDRLFRQGDVLAFKFIDAVSRDLCRKLRATNQVLYDFYAHPQATTRRLEQMATQAARATAEECDRIKVVPIDEKRPRVKRPLPFSPPR